MNGPLEYFLHWEKTVPKDIFLRQPYGDKWKTRTWSEAGVEIRKIAGYLESLQFPPHSHIALLSKNCSEWIMADLAIMMAGHVTVPVYPTLSADGVRQIIEHSDSKAVIIGKLDNYSSQSSAIPDSVNKISISTYGIKDGAVWEELIESQSPIVNPVTLAPDDILTIIYTSGTTGTPKGVVHTMGNFDTTVKMAQKHVGFPDRPRVMSYLPLSHIAERLGGEFEGLYKGAQFSFPETLESFAKNLVDTKPNYFIAVPRIWTKFQEKILEKMPQKKLDRLLPIPIIGSIVKGAIKKKLGLNKASLFISGAAPLSKSTFEWFDRLGITIYQVLGMTEDCVYAHFNRPGANKFGTVGLPMEGLQVKLADNGELRVKSSCLMKGYYKNPELTATMFDEEGYLKTGDTGEIDSEGFLTIIGRVKDQFKTDKGKYISPAPIELKLMQNTDIEQVCIVGMGVPQPIALTVLSTHGKGKTKEELSKSLTSIIDSVNTTLESHEQIEKAVIMKSDWTVENEMITPSMKLKRNAIEKIHLPNYPKWYAEDGKIVWE
ncbi:MAG TPA: AMP-binding protein [Cyclobacteriaceae bacterium]|nr:AMP-binding protein [Cyclobacteriaceae bacterium]